ncbi:MAG: 4Fe-4S binding protein [Methanoregulaceae archaeon]|jgi:dissimilatory sulfite reductase (desulfoviridin) alpha/beta subunit
MYKEFGVHMKGGVITERNSDLCTVRIRLPAGKISVEQLRGIALIAKKYGSGVVHCTTRQSIEIPHILPSSLLKIEKALEKNGTPIGSERDEVVNILACPGIERCKFANIDTITLAQNIDSKLFGKEMPVKIRIAISGCPNACTSPMLNEIGIMGRVRPVRLPGECTGCGTCVQYCKENAILIKNGISVLDPKKCVQCGVCIQSCPFDIIQAEHRHYLILVGGRRGRHPHIGRELVSVENADQVISIVEKIVTWVFRRAWSGRLLSDQMDDIQFEKFKDEIVKNIKK